MDTTQATRTKPNNPIDDLMLERRRADVLVLTAAHRAALAAYKQHVNETIERVLKLIDAAEAWGSGGEAPELATRYGATARACFEGVCSSRGAAGCDCAHCIAADAIGEFSALGFGHLEHPALVALGWVTGYVMGERDSNLESALEGIGEAFAEETNSCHVADKVSEAAYAGAARALAAQAVPTGGTKTRRPRRASAPRSAQLNT